MLTADGSKQLYIHWDTDGAMRRSATIPLIFYYLA